MNRFFEKGIELAEQEYAKTGNFKDAIAVLEHTCEMCKSNMPCYSCAISNKVDEFEHPREIAVTKEDEDKIVMKRKTTITTVIEEEVTVYKVGDKMIDGHLFLKYRR